MVAFLVLLYTIYLAALVICGIFLRIGLFPGPSPVGMTIVPAALAGVALVDPLPDLPDPGRLRARRGALGTGAPARAARASHRQHPGHHRHRHAHGAVAPAPPQQRPAGDRRRGGFLGREHRGPVGVLPRVRRGRPEGRAGAGLLRRHDREPAAVLPRRGGVGRRRHDRGLPRVRRAQLDRVRVGAGVPRDRLLAADPARDLRLPAAAPDGRPVARGGRPAACPRARGGRRGPLGKLGPARGGDSGLHFKK